MTTIRTAHHALATATPIQTLYRLEPRSRVESLCCN
jgi:hypothetical protein